MTDSKVKQVTRAIYEYKVQHKLHFDPQSASIDPEPFAFDETGYDAGVARAAIAAIREPTEAMLMAGAWHFGDAMNQLPSDDYHEMKAGECWQAMHAAALEESD